MDQYRGGCLSYLTKKRFLLVDDDADIRRGYQVPFSRLTTTIPSWPRINCRRYREVDAHKPYLIILDLGLPTGQTSESILPLPAPGGFLARERLTADNRDQENLPAIIAQLPASSELPNFPT